MFVDDKPKQNMKKKSLRAAVQIEEDAQMNSTQPMNESSRGLTAARRVAMTLLLVGAIAAMPTPAQELVIRGGQVVNMAGASDSSEAVRADVLIRDGRIAEVGDVDAGSGAEVIDATGLTVYPGFVDAMNQIGLVEISSISATVDGAEMGSYNAHLTAATAIHPASEVIPVTRETGVAYSLVVPRPGSDGVVGGRAALVVLDGWTVEEMAITDSAAMFVAWPEVQTRTFDFATFAVKEAPYTEAKKTAEKKIDELRDWLDAARHYAKANRAGSERLETDLQLEWLAKVLPESEGGEGMKVLVAANAKSDIEAAVTFAEEQGLEIVVAGGRDAWMLKDMLAEKDIPVILGLVATLPQQTDEPYDRPFRKAAALVDAGVRVAFGSAASSASGPSGPHSARTLPFEVGMATAYGLDREAALVALTRAPAEMLGLGDEIGTIEVGKLANLIVVEGDPLDIRSQVRHLVIGGVEVSTDNRHRQLYERYRSRPMPSE